MPSNDAAKNPAWPRMRLGPQPAKQPQQVAQLCARRHGELDLQGWHAYPRTVTVQVADYLLGVLGLQAQVRPAQLSP